MWSTDERRVFCSSHAPAISAAEQPAHPRVHGWHVPCRTSQGPLRTRRQLQSCACTRHHLRNQGELHSHTMTMLDRQRQTIRACCAADIISAIEFDASGQHLATGDRGGRVVLFERVAIQNVRLRLPQVLMCILLVLPLCLCSLWLCMSSSCRPPECGALCACKV